MGYAYQMKNTVGDEKVAAKIDEDDKKKITDACDEALQWLDSSQAASKEEYEGRQKDLEAICTPIVTKMYQQASGDAGAGGGMPGGMPGMGGMGGMPGMGGMGGGGAKGPTVEEVD